MKNILLSFTLLFSVLFTAAQSTDTSPRVVFGNLKHEGPYDRSEILVQEKLNVSSADDKTYQIVSYKLTISPTKGKPIRFEEQGDKLSVKLQGALNQIVGGDKILIESVFAIVNGDKSDILSLNPIEIVIKEYKSDDEIAYSDVRVEMDTTLQATFGEITDFSIRHSLEKVLGQDQLLVNTEDGRKFEVTKFKLIAVPKKGAPRMASSSSNKLTGQMLKMIAKLGPGDRIIVEGIRAQSDEDGKMIKANLSPVIITLY